MKNSNSGIGLFGTIGVVFVILKLVGLIDWSWWSVLLPFYLALIIIVFVIMAMFIIAKLTNSTVRVKKLKGR